MYTYIWLIIDPDWLKHLNFTTVIQIASLHKSMKISDDRSIDIPSNNM